MRRGLRAQAFITVFFLLFYSSNSVAAEVSQGPFIQILGGYEYLPSSGANDTDHGFGGGGIVGYQAHPHVGVFGEFDYFFYKDGDFTQTSEATVHQMFASGGLRFSHSYVYARGMFGMDFWQSKGCLVQEECVNGKTKFWAAGAGLQIPLNSKAMFLIGGEYRMLMPSGKNYNLIFGHEGFHFSL